MLDNLNDMQKEAVIYKDGPMLILAGAGSGKTKVLTTRIAYLINEYNVNPYNILAITFTNKAAKEMKERVCNIIGNDTPIIISTFHSFGVRILRENYNLLGYKSNFVIIDSDDSLTLIKKILKDMNIDPKTFNPYMIRNKISSSKNEFVSPEEYKKFVCNENDDIIYKVYKKYQEILFKNNSVDFDDLLILPIKLFKENEEVLQKYQERFKYILIDEYQDTNHAQYLLVKLTSEKYKNICVVGDNDQSIYGFRGSNYKNILNFEKDYKDCKVVILEQNYRSSKTILDAANSVIKNNELRKDKNLWSDNKVGENITYYKALDEIDEALYVIRKIKELKKENIEYSDIAVLYRTNAQSRVFEQEMLKQNIPFKIVGSFYFYSRREIKDLLAYLRLVLNEDDDISLERAINTPKRGIGTKTIQDLYNVANKDNTSLFNAITSGKALEFKNLIIELKNDLEKHTLTEFIDIVLEKSGIKKELENEKTLEADIRLENLNEFKSVTKTFEERLGEISLEEFLTEISLVSDVSEYKDSKDCITLMTVHSVKGLEYPCVFVVGLEEGIFPHRNSMDSKSDLEEERRLMYVAITRAKNKLFITNARRRMIFGSESSSIPSRFINEIDSELIDYENKEEPKIVKHEKNVYEDDQEFSYGDKIMHDTYGKGVVVDVSGSIISVAFNKDVGIKKLLKNHKSIKKI